MALLLLCACPTTHIWHLLHTLLNPKLVEISPSSSYFYLVRMFSLTLYWALCFSFEQSTYMTVFFPFSRYSLHALMMASHCSFGLIHFFWLVWIFRKQSKGLPDRCLTQPVWTEFLSKSIWIRPQGSQGCQKMRQDPLNMPCEVWCANIASKLKNTQKSLLKQVFFDTFFQF